MLLVSNDKISIHSLSKEEFGAQPNYFTECFTEIADSNHILIQPRDWEEFFEQHPKNSFLYAVAKDKIIGAIYCSPHRDYRCYDEYGTDNYDNWGINYLIVHKKYHSHKIGRYLFNASMQDLRNKHAKSVFFMPGRKSINLYHNCVEDKQVGTLSVSQIRKYFLKLEFNSQFLSQKSSTIEADVLVSKKLPPPDFDVFDYYFFPHRIKQEKDLP